jgi:basic membrane protein A and related proteins
MRITSRASVALAVAGALLLAACGEAPEEPAAAPEAPVEEPAETVDFKACQITDTGGIDDKSFNETAWNGLLRARDELGVEVAYLESQSETDYEPNIAAFIEQDCDLIITVGFLLGDATEAAAIANPDRNFAIIDYAYETEYPNLLGIVFATDQAAFLAGYVAAATTETGKVGTWGGIAIPPVTAFMDGYLAGVKYYNQENGTAVEVLGWDGTDGVFTGSFEEQDLGNAGTTELLQNGADIIMPVAGPAGLGAATAIQDFGSGKMIWVDTDGFFSTAFGSIILTSVEKKMDNAVFAAVQSSLEGTFTGGTYLGTLDNEGVGVSPFHDFDADVPAEVKAALETIIAGLIDGSISTKPADYS